MNNENSEYYDLINSTHKHQKNNLKNVKYNIRYYVEWLAP